MNNPSKELGSDKAKKLYFSTVFIFHTRTIEQTQQYRFGFDHLVFGLSQWQLRELNIIRV